MLLKIIYGLVRRLFSLAVLMFRCDSAKDAELSVLRHESAVLRRHAGRVRYDPADRLWFAALARLIPRTCWPGIFPVTPATLLSWHGKLAASKYDTRNRRGLARRGRDLVPAHPRRGPAPGNIAVIIHTISILINIDIGTLH